MPSGQNSTPPTPADVDLPTQVKICSYCRAPVAQDIDYTPLLFLHAQDPDPSALCSVCRDRSLPQRPSIAPVARAVEFEVPRRPLIQQQQPDDCIQFPTTGTIDSVEFPCSPDPAYSPRNQDAVHHILKVKIPSDSSYQFRNPAPAPESISPSPSSSSSSTSYTYTPDPLLDITRLRVRSPTHHCLYPGATFSGTQKSGRNSYDVNVTIVDVDFSSSFLCGYLRIRGLTEDWPELTTYFDAEIIGSRYGFLTRNWGATEQEDMVHWQRFPAFRQVKNDLKRPYLTIPENDRGAVFMRWKERFLVPDHRVQDINGASFAGFYYVCVDFNNQPQTPMSHHMPLIRETEDVTQPELSQPIDIPVKTEPNQRSRRRSIDKDGRHNRLVSRSSSRGGPGPLVATMSGFYFHQNSEPYQQLSLNHVPETTDSCFELR